MDDIVVANLHAEDVHRPAEVDHLIGDKDRFFVTWHYYASKANVNESKKPAAPSGNGSPIPKPDNPVAMKAAAQPEFQEGDTLATLLHRAFGFSSFRPNQEAVCQAAIDGKDVLLVMPTGSGKSLCYQLPALAFAGLTVVVSPLIALMKDQIDFLQRLIDGRHQRQR
jgi:superfamily II DNA helicase RecQ